MFESKKLGAKFFGLLNFQFPVSSLNVQFPVSIFWHQTTAKSQKQINAKVKTNKCNFKDLKNRSDLSFSYYGLWGEI